MIPVHIIASCTERKKLPSPSRLQLRSVPGRSTEARAATWCRRLMDHTGLSLPARDLYAGDHWAIARELPIVAEAAGLVGKLWVASAGYGLFPASAAVHAYSATFSRGAPDSVLRSREDARLDRICLRTWWSAINSVPGPDRAAARFVRTLAEQSPNARILIVASANYVAAMEDDLVAASLLLKSPTWLVVVSGRSSIADGLLARNWVTAEAVLLDKLGGARGSLHARVARKILEEAKRWPIDADVLRDRFARLVRRSPTLVRYDREALNDKDVCGFIAHALKRDAAATHTRLLRTLRSSGRACEQKRFRQLYFQVKEERETCVNRA